ncbi:hypothetical protein [Aquimarina intermedia]|uniref:Uncharacterized protein n=1 Tax=Aquimarina intermedia TaxID=350814 RepID=A0A5S5C4Q7_9FLAO|nr:hypothetical protein [Aquimarina intermedia]TYP72943.1 hypothetical protein BD809_106196 [Aquimarina intermedia]
MFKIVSYAKFLLRSTNQHGVHSPFVYLLITRCLYVRKRKATDHQVKKICKNSKNLSVKESRLLLRLISYLDIQTVLVLGKDQRSLAQVMELYTGNLTIDTALSSAPYDLIIAESNEVAEANNAITMLLSAMHNDSILVLRGIHSDPDSETLWQTLCKNESVTASIDLYRVGLLFIRREQLQEQFTIRW